jgi:5-methylcytosine-specific restriction endonuclease McrA
MTCPNKRRISQRKDRVKRYRRIQYMIRRIKEETPCEHCGVRFKPKLMHFHHRNPEEKLFRVANAKSVGSFRALAREVAKCDLLCEHCHGKEHGR